MITSRSNAVVKQMRALQDRKERDSQHAFVVEGIHPVWRAVEEGAAIRVLVVAPDLLRSADARAMVASQIEAGRHVVAVSSDIFGQVVEREHPSGLAAIVAAPLTQLADLPVTPQALYAAFHMPGNPGNLGTAVRTMDAVGGTGVILIAGGTDLYHPSAVKASMGTLFALHAAHAGTWEEARDWFRANGLTIVATSSHADHQLWATRLPMPCVVVFGNEGDGLPDAVVRDSDMALRIPMAHGGSLNVAAAAAVVLFELRRQTIGDLPRTAAC